MNPTETLSVPQSYIGHIRKGVVVFNTEASLTEGQAVRVEPLTVAAEQPLDAERADRVRRL